MIDDICLSNLLKNVLKGWKMAITPGESDDEYRERINLMLEELGDDKNKKPEDKRRG